MNRALLPVLLVSVCFFTTDAFSQNARRESVNRNRNVPAAAPAESEQSETDADNQVQKEDGDEESLEQEESLDAAIQKGKKNGVLSEAEKEKLRKSISVRPDGTILVGKTPVSAKTMQNIAKRLYKIDFDFRKDWDDFMTLRKEYDELLDVSVKQLVKNDNYKQDLIENPFIVDATDSYLYKQIMEKDKRIYAELQAKRERLVEKRTAVLEKTVVYKAALLNDKEDARTAQKALNDSYRKEHNKPIDEIVASPKPLEEAFIEDLQDSYKEFSKEYAAIKSSISNYDRQAESFANKGNAAMAAKNDDLKKAKEKELKQLVVTWVYEVYGSDAIVRAKKARAKAAAKKKN